MNAIALTVLLTTTGIAAAHFDPKPIREWPAPGEFVSFAGRSDEAIFERMSRGLRRVALSSGEVLSDRTNRLGGDVIPETEKGDASPDGSLYAMSTETGIEVVDLASGRLWARGHGAGSLRFTPDGQAVLGVQGPLLSCDLIRGDSLSRVWQLEVPRMELLKLAVSIPARIAAVVARDWQGGRHLLIFRLSAGHERATYSTSLSAPAGWGIEDLAFSPDGRFLAAGVNGRGLAVWDIASTHLLWHNDERAMFEGRSITYSPDGTLIASGGSGISVRDAATGRVLQRWMAHGPDGVLSVAFAPDGTQLVSIGFNRRAAIWRLRPAVTR